MQNTPLTLALVCALLGFSAAVATAESITYTYTGTGFRTGTSFTYIDPDGFLTFDTGKVAPTTASHLYFKGIDAGQIVFFDFVNTNLYYLYTSTSYVEDSNEGFNLSTLGTQHSNFADLTITSTSAVPEPSSLILLATATLGLAAPLRRKLVRAVGSV